MSFFYICLATKQFKHCGKRFALRLGVHGEKNLANTYFPSNILFTIQKKKREILIDKT